MEIYRRLWSGVSKASLMFPAETIWLDDLKSEKRLHAQIMYCLLLSPNLFAFELKPKILYVLNEKVPTGLLIPVKHSKGKYKATAFSEELYTRTSGIGDLTFQNRIVLFDKNKINAYLNVQEYNYHELSCYTIKR